MIFIPHYACPIFVFCVNAWVSEWVSERDIQIHESQTRGGRGPSWAVAPEKRNYRHIIKADTASFKSYNHLVHVMTFIMQAWGVTASATSLHEDISTVHNSNLLNQKLHVRTVCRALSKTAVSIKINPGVRFWNISGELQLHEQYISCYTYSITRIGLNNTGNVRIT